MKNLLRFLKLYSKIEFDFSKIRIVIIILNQIFSIKTSILYQTGIQ